MSLRFDRRISPAWNERTSCVEFACVDSQSRQSVRCAVSRAALEDSTGEALNGSGCIAMFARHLGRVVAVLDTMYAAHPPLPGGTMTADTDDLLQHHPVFERVVVAAHASASI